MKHKSFRAVEGAALDAGRLRARFANQDVLLQGAEGKIWIQNPGRMRKYRRRRLTCRLRADRPGEDEHEQEQHSGEKFSSHEKPPVNPFTPCQRNIQCLWIAVIWTGKSTFLS